MLELRKYPKAELSALFGTRDTQGLKRKLERYGIVYEEAGRGNTMTFDIKEITDPFKIFCITELDFDGGTDFKKVLGMEPVSNSRMLFSQIFPSSSTILPSAPKS